MTKTVNEREIVLEVLMEVLEREGLIHQVLSAALRKYQYLDKSERAFITKVSEGTLEYLLQIDAVLGGCSKTPVKKMKPLIRSLLRMSVYQILYMDRVPDSAVCNEAVKLAGKRGFAGLKGFVNGVLRTVSRQKESFSFEDNLSLRYSMPQWIVDLWEKQFGREETETMLAALLEERPLSVRFLTEKSSKEEILASLMAQGIECEPSPLTEEVYQLSHVDSLEQTKAFCEGLLAVQDASSALVSLFAAPKKGDFVLDVCAAPGGKALHMAELLRDGGFVEARDVSERKTALILENAERMGCQNLRVKVWDARVLDASMIEKADIVLADLPCSGLGIIGRKPDIKYHTSLSKLEELAALQRELLSVVQNYVKEGGLLLYSTCTINYEENEGNLAWFLEQFPFERVDLSKRCGSYLAQRLARGEDLSLKEGWIQLKPGIHPCDGFFLSVVRKKKREESLKNS